MNELNNFLAVTKNNFGVFGGMIFGLLSPIQPILLLVFAFIVADTIFGVWAARKTNKKITSRRLSSFIGKMIVYSCAVILTYALDKLLLGEFLLHIISINLLATKVTSMALIFAEIFSIDEKLVMVKKKGIWDYFKQLLGVAKKIKKEAEELKEE